MQNSIHGGGFSSGTIQYDFSVNINPLPTPQPVKDAMSEALEHVDCYPDYDSVKLKDALASKYHIKSSQVAVGNGSSELFFAIVNAFSPCRILIPVPSFFGYEYAACRGSNEVCFLENAFSGSAFSESGSRLMEELNKNYDLLFLANPNNPTGQLIERELLLSLFDECIRLGTIVILDECFYEFTGGKDSAFQCLKEYPNVIVVNSFTKTFSIPGVRIGYLACFDEEIIRMIQRQLPEWNISGIAESAGCACLTCGEHIKESAEYVKKERAYLVGELKKLNIRCFDSNANFILIYDERPLYEELFQHGILIRDASNFRGLSKGYYRIAVKSREENEILIRSLSSIK